MDNSSLKRLVYLSLHYLQLALGLCLKNQKTQKNSKKLPTLKQSLMLGKVYWHEVIKSIGCEQVWQMKTSELKKTKDYREYKEHKNNNEAHYLEILGHDDYSTYSGFERLRTYIEKENEDRKRKNIVPISPQQYFLEINYFWLRAKLRECAKNDAVVQRILSEIDREDNGAISNDTLDYAQALEKLYLKILYARKHSEIIENNILFLYRGLTARFKTEEREYKSKHSDHIEFTDTTLSVLRQAQLKYDAEIYIEKNKNLLLRNPGLFRELHSAIEQPYQANDTFETRLSKLISQEKSVITKAQPSKLTSQEKSAVASLEKFQSQCLKKHGDAQNKVAGSKKDNANANKKDKWIVREKWNIDGIEPEDSSSWKKPLIYHHYGIGLNHSRQQSVLWINQMLASFNNKTDAILFLFRHYRAINHFSSYKSTLSLAIEHRLVKLLGIDAESYKDTCRQRNASASFDTAKFFEKNIKDQKITNADELNESVFEDSNLTELQKKNHNLLRLHNFIAKTEVSNAYKLPSGIGWFFDAKRRSHTQLNQEIRAAQSLIKLMLSEKRLGKDDFKSELQAISDSVKDKNCKVVKICGAYMAKEPLNNDDRSARQFPARGRTWMGI